MNGSLNESDIDKSSSEAGSRSRPSESAGRWTSTLTPVEVEDFIEYSGIKCDLSD